MGRYVFSKRKVVVNLYVDPTIYARMLMRAARREEYHTEKGLDMHQYIHDVLFNLFAPRDYTAAKEYKYLRRAAEVERQIWDQAYDRTKGKCYTRKLKDYARM